MDFWASTLFHKQGHAVMVKNQRVGGSQHEQKEGGMPKGAQQSDPRGCGVTKGWGTPGPLPRHPGLLCTGKYIHMCMYVYRCAWTYASKSKNT